MKDSKFYKKLKLKNKKVNVNSRLISQMLIAIIVVLLSLIITNFSSEVRTSFKKQVIEENMSFTSFNRFYDKFFGKLKEEKETIDVSSEINDIKLLDWKEVNGSYEIEVGINYPLTFLEPGIIVFIGDKDEYKDTVIVQGNDGVDLWYSNVDVTEYSLYDYVRRGELVGSLKSDILVISILKDGQKLKYDEYFKEN